MNSRKFTPRVNKVLKYENPEWSPNKVLYWLILAILFSTFWEKEYLKVHFYNIELLCCYYSNNKSDEYEKWDGTRSEKSELSRKVCNVNSSTPTSTLTLTLTSTSTGHLISSGTSWHTGGFYQTRLLFVTSGSLQKSLENRPPFQRSIGYTGVEWGIVGGVVGRVCGGAEENRRNASEAQNAQRDCPVCSWDNQKHLSLMPRSYGYLSVLVTVA